MHLLELQCRDSLDFKYNVNIEENPLNLNIDDYLDLAIRNNKKRRNQSSAFRINAWKDKYPALFWASGWK